MQTSQSLASRAILAVGLMIGFYLLALAIAGALIYIAIAPLAYGQRIYPKLIIFGLASAGTILWSIRPRIDRFVPPGPRLTPRDQPRLFATIEGVAARTQQEMPAEVYLILDPNAWVTQRGGMMGFGSRRVMGVGLTLMQALTIPQFEAVLAHEFGHYHKGDTKLGPWIYKTRSAIGRTITSLSQRSSFLHKPFLWYGNLFLRITQSISRQQEFAADELAARTIGVEAMTSGLKSIIGASNAFEFYWKGDVAPVLAEGYLPPIGAGFAKYLSGKKVSALVKESTDRALTETETDIFDSHPSLRDRVNALGALAGGAEPTDTTPAISLLVSSQGTEQILLEKEFGIENVRKLRPLAWEGVGERVYAVDWERQVSRNQHVLKGVTASQIGVLIKTRDSNASRLKWGEEELDLTDSRDYFPSLLGAALAHALVRQGWSVNIVLGEGMELRREDLSLDPFDAVVRLRDGSLSENDWKDQCERLGIAQLDLGVLQPYRRNPSDSGTPATPTQ